MKKYVVYARVSTKKQGESGLGIEAQKEIARNYVNKNSGVIIAEFIEVSSGTKGRKYKNKQRQERHVEGINEAIQYCKENNATLLVAKLDRLSRDVETLFRILNSGADVVAADLPAFNTLTVGIFATIAQYEAELISERTKNALQAKKKQGFKLGREKGSEITASKKEAVLKKVDRLTDGQRQNVKEAVIAKRKEGKSYEKIAKELRDENKHGRYLINGKKPKFSAVMVYRLLKESKVSEEIPATSKTYTVTTYGNTQNVAKKELIESEVKEFFRVSDEILQGWEILEDSGLGSDGLSSCYNCGTDCIGKYCNVCETQRIIDKFS